MAIYVYIIIIVIACCFIFFRNKIKQLLLILGLILIFCLILLFQENEITNHDGSFEIKETSINDYYSNYVFNFNGDISQIKKIFNYVNADLKIRYVSKKKLDIDKTQDTIKNRLTTTLPRVTEYEFLKPVSGAHPYKQENLIFKFLINQYTGEITRIINKFTDKSIDEIKLTPLNDSVTKSTIKKLNYEYFSKCLNAIQANNKNLALDAHCYKVYNNNNFIFKLQFHNKRNLKIYFDEVIKK